MIIFTWKSTLHVALFPGRVFLRERKGEKEAWDTLYVGVSTEIVNCPVKNTVNVNENVTEMLIESEALLLGTTQCIS